MNGTDEILYVPYQQEGEPARRAALVKVEINLEGLEDDDIQIIGHLTEAAEIMNAVFRDQFEPRTADLRELLSGMIEVAPGEEADHLQDYRTILDMQNSPYALLPRKNHLCPIPASRLRELADEMDQVPENSDELIDLMTQGHDTPDRANYYPEDMTDDELLNLGLDAKRVNSSVVRDTHGDLHMIVNEDRYSETLDEAIQHLRAARDIARDAGFRLYLDAKIVELETGLPEARRLAEANWVKHDYHLDTIVSTALEVYLDNLRNTRGSATGAVYRTNNSAEALLQSLVDHVQEWESNAPWRYRRETIDRETLPKLKFVDVLCWAGDYVTGPFTTIAQSLPNDEWVGKQVGSVNMVYVNTGEAVHKVAGNLAAREFLTAEEFETTGDLLFQANQLHSALHEIGHTTGRQAPEASEGQPSDYLEEEYSFLEELRAELFGLYALDALVRDGVIDENMRRACYNGMLISMITSLKFDPVQAHNKARNGMFHFFQQAGLLISRTEEERLHYALDHSRMSEAVRELLGRVGDIKAEGRKELAAQLREKLVYSDSLKQDVEERTAKFPLGRGLIFPKLKHDGKRYLAELVYPASFSDQEKFSHRILD